MKNFLKLVVLISVSIAVGVWAYRNLPNHYFIEEYYSVQNLDPNNEKDTEALRHNVQHLIQKNIPARYRPNPDHFQCFKIISEAVFFCSADTYRKKEAQYIRTLLQEIIPNEIGWITMDEALDKSEKISHEMIANKKAIADQTKQLEKLKNQSMKNAPDERKFQKTNELYKKSRDLFAKKINILQTMISNISNEDLKGGYQMKLDQTQMEQQQMENEYDAFKAKNKNFVNETEKRDTLQAQLEQLKKSVDQQDKDLSFIEQTMNNPNAIGSIANFDELQLIPDPSRQKFELEYRQSNIFWFSAVVFLLLSNFILRIRTMDLIPFEDATRTEALIQ